MQIKIIFFLFILSACGKQVDISTAKLREQSAISSTKSLEASKEGTLLRASNGQQDRITYQNKNYNVSKHSSHLSLSFIANYSAGASVPVKFIGVVNASDIELETIQVR